MQFKQPITITWADILVEYTEGEERDYEVKFKNGIYNAISRRLKFTNPEMSFTTRIESDRIYVRRLTTEEITQQQQSAVGAG